MQRQPHNTTQPRFLINTRGVLIDRNGIGAARFTGFDIIGKRVTRSELQLLADMLNEPEHMQDWDDGANPERAWSQRIAEQQKHDRLLREDPAYRRLAQEAAHAC